ncbi:MAG: hypothetical protein DI538_03835 [Azospira oryzae]|jgi:ketosteroid isomerase-like protein|nr:hypothetical protein [Cytophaga sp.]PZR40589.1 MAG: hypothetical protein DI538_03835 [Azospira oryzae]
MKNVLIGFFLLLGSYASAQTDQQEINEQVWKPFTKAIMSQDVAAFVGVHSKELIRAERNDKRVLSLEEYKKRMEKGWPAWKESIQKKEIRYVFELRFLERISNGTLAYEVGYFKNESTQLNGEKEIYYGQFQVALRKENGLWKILVDADFNENNTITAKEFLAARPLE